MLRWLRIAALSICALVILLALAGACYQSIETRLDASRYPERGRLEQIQVSAEQARRADHISDKPLVVLTAAENADAILSSGLSKHDFEEFQRIWVDDLQMRLAQLSTRGRRIMVSGSDHDIPSDRPDSVVKEVQELCAAATSLN